MTMNELKFIPLFMVPNSIRFQCNTYHFASSVLLVSVFFMVIITRLVLNGLFVVLFFITFIPVPGLQSGNALACSIANQFFFIHCFLTDVNKKNTCFNCETMLNEFYLANWKFSADKKSSKKTVEFELYLFKQCKKYWEPKKKLLCIYKRYLRINHRKKPKRRRENIHKSICLSWFLYVSACVCVSLRTFFNV